MSSEALFDKIRSLGNLTPSEARIAEYLDQAYPLLALETVTSISNQANVGRATVVRFIARLGFKNFADFQQSLRSELISRLQSPKDRYHERSKLSTVAADPLQHNCDQVIRNLNEATRRINSKRLLACSKLLATCRGTIYVTGYRTSFGLAHLFSLQLSYLRDNVRLLDDLGGVLPNTVSNLSKQDILISIFQERYARFSEDVMRWFARHGCRMIFLADREAHPLAHLAHIQFVVPSEGISIFKSRCASLAVLETMVDLVAMQLGGSLNRHLVHLEGAFEAFDIFTPWGKKTLKQKSET